jgi:hypothetical protein
VTLLGVYDEMIAADSSLRPQWRRRFNYGLEGMAEGELAKRWLLAERCCTRTV